VDSDWHRTSLWHSWRHATILPAGNKQHWNIAEVLHGLPTTESGSMLIRIPVIHTIMFATGNDGM
jgi:hypothetical protein